MNRYLIACNAQSKKAMMLYRLNLRLSQQLFTMIRNFEVALRNSVDHECTVLFGNNWLIEGVARGGIFAFNQVSPLNRLIMQEKNTRSSPGFLNGCQLTHHPFFTALIIS
jgi:hypothetical protein